MNRDYIATKIVKFIFLGKVARLRICKKLAYLGIFQIIRQVSAEYFLTEGN